MPINQKVGLDCAAVALMNASGSFNPRGWLDDYPTEQIAKLSKSLKCCGDGTDPKEFEKHPLVGDRVEPSWDSLKELDGFFVLYSFTCDSGHHPKGAHYIFCKCTDNVVITYNHNGNASNIITFKFLYRDVLQTNNPKRNIPINASERYGKWAQHITFPIVWKCNVSLL